MELNDEACMKQRLNFLCEQTLASSSMEVEARQMQQLVVAIMLLENQMLSWLRLQMMMM